MGVPNAGVGRSHLGEVVVRIRCWNEWSAGKKSGGAWTRERGSQGQKRTESNAGVRSDSEEIKLELGLARPEPGKRAGLGGEARCQEEA